MKVATLIARAIDAKSGRLPTIYNEKRSFGDSMKVIGWDRSEYERCANLLNSLGYSVRIVRTRKIDGRGWGSYGGALRLWIYA